MGILTAEAEENNVPLVCCTFIQPLLYNHFYVYIQVNVKRRHGILMTVSEFLLNAFLSFAC